MYVLNDLEPWEINELYHKVMIPASSAEGEEINLPSPPPSESTSQPKHLTKSLFCLIIFKSNATMSVTKLTH